MKRLILIAASIAALFGGILAATPAFAQSCATGSDCANGNITAQAEVATEITLTVDTPTIDFGTVVPDTASAVQTATYVVSDNDGTYSIMLAPGGTGLANGTNVIPNADISVDSDDSGAGNDTNGNFASPLYTSEPQGTTTFNDHWQMTVPTADMPAASGTYSESFTYEVIAD